MAMTSADVRKAPCGGDMQGRAVEFLIPAGGVLAICRHFRARYGAGRFKITKRKR